MCYVRKTDNNNDNNNNDNNNKNIRQLVITVNGATGRSSDLGFQSKVFTSDYSSTWKMSRIGTTWVKFWGDQRCSEKLGFTSWTGLIIQIQMEIGWVSRRLLT